MATTRQLVGITSQYNEIVKRVGNGSLDPIVVKQALQDIIEGKLPQMQNWNPPTWWRTAEQQLERARQLWPNAVLPEPPKAFAPRTKSEVLLLHVPDSFDSLWDKVVTPESCPKYRWDAVKSDPANLRLAPGKVDYTELVWLGFDPEYGNDERPDSLWGQANLAGCEVFSALIQFPNWHFSWLSTSAAPNLSGYQLKDDEGWLCVPTIYKRNKNSALHLSSARAFLQDNYWASPSVREC